METREPVPLEQARATNRLVEMIGKDKVRAIAALGIAAAGLLGVSGKPDSGAGVGVEVPNPITGKQVSVGVFASSSERYGPWGIPEIPAYDKEGKKVFPYKDLKVYQVGIGNAMVGVYIADVFQENGESVKTIIGIHPVLDTPFSKK